MRKRWSRSIVFVAVAGLLAACGGEPGESGQLAGGATEGVIQASPPVPIKALGQKPISDNLILNGSFEEERVDPASGWAVDDSTGVRMERSDRFSAEGEASLRMQVSERDSVVLAQTVDVATRKSSHYALRALVLAGQRPAQARLEVFDAARGPEGFHVAGQTRDATDERWTSLEASFELPLYTMQAALRMYTAQGMYNAPKGSGEGGPWTLWLDRVELYNVVAPERTNLLANGDFEAGGNGATSWGLQSGVKPSSVAETVNPKFSAGALQLDTHNARGVGVWQSIKGLTPGKKYRVQGYIKTRDVFGAAALAVQDTGTGLNVRSRGVTGTDDWQLQRIDFTFPKGAKQIMFLLSRPAAKGAPRTPCTMWFDQCELFAL